MTEIAESMKKLIHKRGKIKARMTIFRNHLETLLNKNLNADYEFSREERIELEIRLDKFVSALDDFEAVQSEIDYLEERTETTKESAEFQKLYFALVSRAKSLLTEIIEKSDNEIKTVSSVNMPDPAQAHSQKISSAVQLPIIEIPKFKGEYENWLEFRDTFTSLVHANAELTNAQKFHYLRSSLESEAARIIQSISISEANYTVAWELVIKRYNDEDVLVDNHIKAMFHLPRVEPESASSLRKLLDYVCKNVRSLELLNLPIEHWDIFINYLIVDKLDAATVKEWEKYKIHNDRSYKNLVIFLENKANLLAKIQNKIQSKPKRQITNTAFEVNKTMKCAQCSKNHILTNCSEFQNLNANDRYEASKKLGLCINCLKFGHKTRICRLPPCTKCGGKHHVMLHFEKEDNKKENILVNAFSRETTFDSSVLLPTALVKILDSRGKGHYCRALLDSGSQSSFLTQRICDRLNIPTSAINISIVGITQNSSNIRNKCEITISSRFDTFLANMSCLVIPKFEVNLPSQAMNIKLLNIPSNLNLADPSFGKPEAIDLLIGAEHFWNFLCVGQFKINEENAIAQKTRLGWVISGSCYSFPERRSVCNFSCNHEEIQNKLEKFWDTEEVDVVKRLTKEEESCEQHFKDTFKRSENGQFVVSLPFKESPALLGDSKRSALKQFLRLEKRLQEDEKLREMYVNFMKEYILLGHMEISESSEIRSGCYYLPHHGVLNESSTTTKLRVVFNGSAPSSSGRSLNSLQMVGPTIQQDLFSILTRFRKHKFVISADIQKMYRQVLIDPAQRSLQRIIWRKTPSDPLIDYDLKTVTYGTTAASFLAIRCLMQLAFEIQEDYPQASNAIQQDFYVDDILTGSDSIEDLSILAKQISEVLKSGHFLLHKWLSNDPTILKNIAVESKTEGPLNLGDQDYSKTLGLLWSAKKDHLKYKIAGVTERKTITKRLILSETAQIFDPLGLVSPCTIVAKIILQELWQLKISWDESLPLSLQSKWLEFRKELLYLNYLEIPRFVGIENYIKIECHGFSDASQKAYGACIYVRSISTNNEISVRLLCAKSKVAPLKTVSVPRLELCGALLMSRLFEKINKALAISFASCHFWTDSTIVLGWIRTPPKLLKTFVENRVVEIQNITQKGNWRHVSSEDNPADIVSRGLYPDKLAKSSLWWDGPFWLNRAEENWPNNVVPILDVEIPEMKKVKPVASFLTTANNTIISRYSNYNRLKRIVALCLRFINNTKLVPQKRTFGSLSTIELNSAQCTLVKLSQAESFAHDLKNLKLGMQVHKRSKILPLSPFLDEAGIIRVGGRLQNSNFSYGKRHPMLLCKNSALTRLILRTEHEKMLHCGPTLLLGSIRDQFWPISGRSMARNIVRNCIACCRHNAKVANPLMGNLPRDRAKFNSPFSTCGVDYAGPFAIRDKKGRGNKTTKWWLCLFICFSTRSIHLELVSSLSSESFIAAFRRFTSRRGLPLHIHSDNGTNFVGANVELKELFACLTENSTNISNHFANQGVNWHFIPASSPNFGGLWEAGVKSVKHHLKRVMGNITYSFEEFHTLIVQIEAILNSRPISPLSTDPNDTQPLTPAHFLIGRSLISAPDPDVTELPQNRLSRYQLVQQTIQHFWARWYKEYISDLQVRTKWKSSSANATIGSLVLVKDNHLPPRCWKLGRIVALHKGESDGVVRVVSVKTSANVYKRAINKLCVLPID